MPSKHAAGGCGCCDTCTDCEDLYAKYGYTSLSISSLEPPKDFYDGVGTPETWAGFVPTSIAIPGGSGGICSDVITQGVGMSLSQTWYPTVALTNGARLGTSEKVNLVAANEYACVDGQDGQSLTISISYILRNLTGFSEAAFTGYTWTSIAAGRRATKAIGGATAIWTHETDFFGFLITGTIVQTSVGGIGATTLTLPTFAWDPLGVMVGTVAIS